MKRGGMGKIKPKTVGEHTKVYLKKCRGLKKGCNHQFFTQQPNKLYCSAWCRHESIRESHRKSDRRNYIKNKKRKILKTKGTFNYESISPITIIGHISPQTLNYNEGRFYCVSLSVQTMKNKTLSGRYSKGKQKNPSSNPDEDSPLITQYQYVTEDDLYHISTSYLKENNLKCPECGTRQNLVERALLVCSNPKCGLVLGAPILHPGFSLYDLTPIKKVAPTVQDFPPIDFTEKNKKSKKVKSFEVVKEAHDKAFQKYEKETGGMFEDSKEYSDNDPLNNAYWNFYKKKVYCK